MTPPRAHASLIVALALSSLVSSREGAAQEQPAPTPAQLAHARALFEQGSALARDERWVEAANALQQSCAIVRRPGSLLNLGIALVRLGRSLEALATLEEFLRVTDPRVDLERVATARAEMQTARARIATVRLTLDPSGARLRIDGAVREVLGGVAEVQLDPGHHVFEASAPGRATAHAEVDLAPGQTVQQRVVLTSEAAGLLRVEATPRELEISVDGEVLVGAEVPIASGVHRVEGRWRGRVRVMNEVVLSPGESRRLVLECRDCSERSERRAVPVGAVVGGVLGAVAVVGLGVGVAIVATIPSQPYGGTTGVTISAVRLQW